MKYIVKFTQAAGKDLRRLDRSTIKRIQDRIEELSDDPLSPRISKSLRMFPDQRSSRVGDWRLIYEVHEAEKTVWITAVRPRGKAY